MPACGINPVHAYRVTAGSAPDHTVPTRTPRRMNTIRAKASEGGRAHDGERVQPQRGANRNEEDDDPLAIDAAIT